MGYCIGIVLRFKGKGWEAYFTCGGSFVAGVKGCFYRLGFCLVCFIIFCGIVYVIIDLL